METLLQNYLNIYSKTHEQFPAIVSKIYMYEFFYSHAETFSKYDLFFMYIHLHLKVIFIVILKLLSKIMFYFYKIK